MSDFTADIIRSAVKNSPSPFYTDEKGQEQPRLANISKSGHDVEDFLREENERQRSIEDQVDVMELLIEEEVFDPESSITRKGLKDLLEERDVEISHSLNTVIKNLVAAGLLTEFERPGPSMYVIRESDEEFIMGEDIEAIAKNEISSLISHVESDERVRTVLASEFDIEETSVEDYLRGHDPIQTLNQAVGAIREDNTAEVGDYGRILFVRKPNRYHIPNPLAEKIQSNDP